MSLQITNNKSPSEFLIDSLYREDLSLELGEEILYKLSNDNNSPAQQIGKQAIPHLQTCLKTIRFLKSAFFSESPFIDQNVRLNEANNRLLQAVENNNLTNEDNLPHLSQEGVAQALFLAVRNKNPEIVQRLSTNPKISASTLCAALNLSIQFENCGITSLRTVIDTRINDLNGLNQLFAVDRRKQNIVKDLILKVNRLLRDLKETMRLTLCEAIKNENLNAAQELIQSEYIPPNDVKCAFYMKKASLDFREKFIQSLSKRDENLKKPMEEEKR